MRKDGMSFTGTSKLIAPIAILSNPQDQFKPDQRKRQHTSTLIRDTTVYEKSTPMFRNKTSRST